MLLGHGPEIAAARFSIWRACAVLAVLHASAAGFKVIGVGWPKTGLASLEAGLTLLGFEVYRMGHNDKNKRHQFEHYVTEQSGHQPDLTKWLSIIKSGDSLELLDQLADELVKRGFDAILDVPMEVTALSLRLAMRFPDAKVILTEHADSHAWFKSYQLHMQDFSLATNAFSPRRDGHSARKRASRQVHEAVCRERHKLPLVPSDADAASYIAAYEDHHTNIRAAVPANRLLTFEPQQGWEPLCQFLELEVPHKPYPRLNAHGRTEAHLHWQEQYNFKFELCLFLLFVYVFGSLGWWAFDRYRAKTKILVEKANV